MKANFLSSEFLGAQFAKQNILAANNKDVDDIQWWYTNLKLPRLSIGYSSLSWYLISQELLKSAEMH